MTKSGRRPSRLVTVVPPPTHHLNVFGEKENVKINGFTPSIPPPKPLFAEGNISLKKQMTDLYLGVILLDIFPHLSRQVMKKHHA